MNIGFPDLNDQAGYVLSKALGRQCLGNVCIIPNKHEVCVMNSEALGNMNTSARDRQKHMI